MKKLNLSTSFDECIHGNYTFTYNVVSVCGELHQKNNEANQDYYICNVRNEIQYAIVADGLGSAAHSQIGAERAAVLLEQMIIGNFTNKSNVSEIEMSLFHNQFCEAWKNFFPNTYREYDTTLLYVILFQHGVIAGSIGDGLILSYINNEVVYLKESKDSFSNQTHSLASDLKNFTSIYIPIDFADDVPILFILTTDGVSDDLKPDMLEQLPLYLYRELTEKGVYGMQKIIEDWIVNWETEHHSDDRTFCMLTIGKGEKCNET